MPTGTETPTDFEAEWSLAEADSRPDGAGTTWERDLNSTLEQALETADQECGTPQDEGKMGGGGSQRFVLEINRDGSVRRAVSDNESPLAICMRRSLGKARFPPPPKQGQRLGIINNTGPYSGPLLPRPASGSITPEVAKRLAMTDMGSAEGTAYMQAMTTEDSELTAMIRKAYERCSSVQRHQSEGHDTFSEAVLEIADSGSVERVLVMPADHDAESVEIETPRALCFRDLLAEATLRAPPWPGFWITVGWHN